MRGHLKQLKKVTATVISIVMLVGTLSGVEAISENNFYEGFENEISNAFSVSKDGGVSIVGDEDNHYLNISPDGDGIEAFAEYKFSCDDNIPLKFSYRFKINSYMQSGQTIAYISKNGLPNIVLETYDGGIAYKNNVGNYVKFINTAVANKWYDISITADYLKSTFNIRLDGIDVASNIENIGVATGADKISFRAKYSPGIAIDDFSTGLTQKPAKIDINGDSEISAAYNSAAEFDYVVAVYDTNNAMIDSPEYIASVIPSSGISAVINGRKVTLKIAEDAVEGEYTLRVIYGSAIKNFHFTFNRYTAGINRINIKGPGRVAYLKDKSNTYTFAATAYDQNNNEIKDIAFNYFLSGDMVDNLSIDSTTGVMTVSGDLVNNSEVTVIAECAENTLLSETKKVMLQDEETYIGDETRFRILLDYVDRAREIGRDPYNDSILIAKAIDRYTMKPAIWNGLEYDFVPSNLAEQGNWFRALQGLYNLTGDVQYKREIDETYDMYLDNYVYDNGTMSMGGHICIDLQTLLPHHGYNSDILELKSHFPYMDPFWEKDPEAARKFAIMFWEGAVTNWNSLAFNRHIGVYDNYTEGNWNNLSGLWVKPTHLGFNPVASNGVSFRSTAADLVNIGVQLYRSTGEEPAREWPRRVLYMYYAATSPETKLGTTIFNSRYRYKNNYEYEDLPEHWWLKPGAITTSTITWYGDRFYVQFYEDMVQKGFVEAVDRKDTSKMPMALEPFYRNGEGDEMLSAYADLELAEAFGFDSEEGHMILDYTLTSIMSLYNYGNYSMSDNKIDQLLVDGTSLNGYVAGRYGYYAEKGTVFERAPITPDFTNGNIRIYLKCKELEEFKEQLHYVWQFVRGDMAYNGFGEVGIAGPGDNVKLDFSNTSSDPRYILAFCNLYEATGNIDYLEMARCIANNIVKNNIVDGLFTYQPSSHYIEIAGRNGIYPYAFAFLEATIRGDSGLLPQYYPYGGYYEDRGILENTGERRTNLHDINMWNRYNVTAVQITDIIVPEEEINMKVGEEKILDITFEPDDATNKSVRINSSDNTCVAVDESTKTIYANKRGSVEIRVISSHNKQLRKTIKVNVE